MSDNPTPQPKLRRTPWGVLVVSLLLGSFVTYLFFGTLESAGMSAPRVTAVSWAAVGAVAAATGVLAWVTHRQYQVQGRPIEPQQAVARLVLGKTAALAGACFTGAYLTICVLYLPRWGAPVPTERVVNAAISAFCAVGLAAAGWFLERACVDKDFPRSGDAPPDVQ